MMFAPIGVFVFKRPEHTRRTLESLALNVEFTASPLFVFCDDSRFCADSCAVEATRKLVREWPHPNKTIIVRDGNWGLAKSIIAGVTELCEKYGKVIVVEDDLIVSPVFLQYLNAALEKYANEPQIMQVSAHMFPVVIRSQYDAVMLPFTTSWGWATWRRAWVSFDEAASDYEILRRDKLLRRRFDLNSSYPYFRMLQKQNRGAIDSWAIRWYLSVFQKGGLVVFPTNSLVLHEGYDETATHASRSDLATKQEVRRTPIISLPPVGYSGEALLEISRFFRRERSLFSRLKRILFRA